MLPPLTRFNVERVVSFVLLTKEIESLNVLAELPFGFLWVCSVGGRRTFHRGKVCTLLVLYEGSYS